MLKASAVTPEWCTAQPSGKAMAEYGAILPLAPVEFEPTAGMAALPEVHPTLASGKKMTPGLCAAINNAPEVNAPEIRLGEPVVVTRGERQSYVAPVLNLGAAMDYADNLFRSVGEENPDPWPDRFYHVTLAYNAGGDPMKSIEPPPSHADR